MSELYTVHALLFGKNITMDVTQLCMVTKFADQFSGDKFRDEVLAIQHRSIR
jgi:hypothetical protein